MDTLLHRFGGLIKGVMEGFDRIVFKGTLKPLAYAAGMEAILHSHGVLNKDYKDWILGKSTAIIRDARNFVLDQCGSDIQYLPSSNLRKETLAHQRQLESGIESGLIGVYSCVESCHTFKAVFNKENSYPTLRLVQSRCKYLYFYYDHKDLGFMSVRLQTWAPFSIQIAVNGRQWLRRQLDNAGIPYILEGNKFLHIDDYAAAQTLLEAQLDTRWVELLSGFLTEVFPSMYSFLDEKIRYTWTLWQSEWAKDYVFCDPQSLNHCIEPVLRHMVITGKSDTVMRYMGKPVMKNGQPYPNADPELITRVNQWYDGMRIRHWLDQNSLKCYNEQNVLRFEFTMNDPTKFLIHRRVTGSESQEKKLLRMRKGIADIPVRTQVCSDRIKNFTEQTAALGEEKTVGNIISEVSGPKKTQGKRYRGLEVTGRDLELLREIADPKYSVDAITNKQLRQALAGTAWSRGLEGRALSARISRNLRLLREHGLIKKLPNQHKYMLTGKGRVLTTALNQFLGAKVCDLSNLAA